MIIVAKTIRTGIRIPMSSFLFGLFGWLECCGEAIAGSIVGVFSVDVCVPEAKAIDEEAAVKIPGEIEKSNNSVLVNWRAFENADTDSKTIDAFVEDGVLPVSKNESTLKVIQSGVNPILIVISDLSRTSELKSYENGLPAVAFSATCGVLKMFVETSITTNEVATSPYISVTAIVKFKEITRHRVSLKFSKFTRNRSIR